MNRQSNFFDMLAKGIVCMLFIFSTSACSSVLPMQTFVVKNNVIQYYIPESITSNGKKTIALDVTFRDDPVENTPALLNYTVISPAKNIEPPAHEAIITDKGSTYILNRISILYREFQKTEGHVRLETSITRNDFLQLASENPSIFMIEYKNGSTFLFKLPKRFVEDCGNISQYVQAK